MFDFDLSIPIWIILVVIVGQLLSISFPLALLLLIFRQNQKRGLGFGFMVAWVALSGLGLIYTGLTAGAVGIIQVVGYSFPLAVLAEIRYWKSGDKSLRLATLAWLSLSGLPWAIYALRNVGVM